MSINNSFTNKFASHRMNACFFPLMSIRNCAFLIANLFISILCSPLLYAQENRPPIYHSGEISHQNAHAGNPVTFSTTWSDPDDDFIVDVTLRYRNVNYDHWTEVVLDWVPGYTPERFEKMFVVDVFEGEYILQFRASDATEEEGPRIHTTDWQDAGTFYTKNYLKDMIGNEYLQTPEPSRYTIRPTLNITASSQEIFEGETVMLTAEAETDPQGEPFFFWNASIGHLHNWPYSPDFQTIFFTAPFLPGEDRIINVDGTVGDNLGYVGSDRIEILVKESGNTDADDPAPVISISTPELVKVPNPFQIQLEIQDFDKNGNDSTDSLVTDIYYRVFEEEYKPLRIGLQGKHDQIQASFPYPYSIPHIIKVVASDGNSQTVVYSNPITVEDSYKIKGWLLTPDRQPIPSVYVTATSQDGETATDQTENNGFFEFDLEEGSYTITPASPEYQFLPASMTVKSATMFTGFEFRFTGFNDTTGPVVSRIDIKPGNDSNIIHPFSNGKTKVAILSSADFNAPEDVDASTLTFGRTGDEESLHIRGNGRPNCRSEDVNDDGLLDLVCHFHTRVANFGQGDTEGILRGKTHDDIDFEGRDHITYPCFNFDVFATRIATWPLVNNILGVTSVMTCYDDDETAAKQVPSE